MEDAKEAKDSLDMATESATPRRVRAPPKGPPPEAKEGAADAKADDGGEKKKKKALPPPSNPPPQGATSAVAAVRAKSSLPPPSGAPPPGAAPSASVAKIRGAARPPSSGPPPSGGVAPKQPMGAPPSGLPPQKVRAPPPAKSDAKDGSDGDGMAAAKDVASPRDTTVAAAERPEAKKVTRPPSASASSADAESKPKRTTASAPTAKPTAPRQVSAVDVLGDTSRPSSTVDDGNDAIASAPFSFAGKEKSPPKIKLSSATSQQQLQHPVGMMRANTSASPAGMANYSSNNNSSSGGSSASNKPAVVKKSTLDILNDTTASINRGTRNVSAPVVGGVDDSSQRPSTATAASFASGGGRAVPFSGSSRPNVPEEELILVKKQEYTNEDVAGDVKKDAKGHLVTNLEDSMEDVEEIPFLEEAKPQPKLALHDKPDPRRLVLHSHDDDPEIVMESKTIAKPTSGAESKSHFSHAHSSETKSAEEKINDDRMLEKPTAKEVEREDLYNELRKLKRNSLTDDELLYAGGGAAGGALTGGEAGGGNDLHEDMDPEAKRTRDSTDSYDDDKDADNSSHSERREKREKRREKRRSKQDEPKKIQAQFFNPKGVPFMPDQLLDFVKRPLDCGRGQIIKCFIERNEQNKLAPIFTLLLEVNSVSGRPILYAKKKGTSRITSHYVISLNKEDLGLSRTMRSHQYIGKLRSSTSMMDYCLYDQGDNPEDLDSDCEVDDELRKSIRAELAVVRFHHTKKPYTRKMEVAIPAIVDNGTSYLDWRPISRDQMMEEHMRAITTAGGQNVLDTQNFTFLHKRETKYDPLSSCIVDFRSRATCTSVKNFQLVHSEPTNDEMKDRYRKLHADYVYEDQGTVSLPQEHVLLQLGKVGKHCFNMDFQYPLSMLQAFAICLARFDSKQR